MQSTDGRSDVQLPRTARQEPIGPLCFVRVIFYVWTEKRSAVGELARPVGTHGIKEVRVHPDGRFTREVLLSKTQTQSVVHTKREGYSTRISIF
jgi:hypothetical protein